MRLALKLTLLFLVASCFTPGRDRREKLFIEFVTIHPDSGRCVKWSHGPLYCWGKYAGLPAPAFSNAPYPTSPERVTLQDFNTADIVQMAASRDALCARLTNGALQCWGGGRQNASHVLGRGRLLNGYTSVPEPVVGVGGRGTTLNKVSSIAAGNGIFCAVFGDQGEVACWGSSGSNYRLGVNRTNPSSTPLAVEAADGASGRLRGAVFLISGWVVLMRDTTLVTWSHGFNNIGSYLGRDNMDIPPTVAPGRVLTPSGTGFLNDVRTASASQKHTCAVLGESTTMYCWGGNASGEVGDGSHVRASLPVKVLPPAGSGSLGRVLGVITPKARTCIINAQLEVYCWGSNDNPGDIYQLGHTGRIFRPTRVFSNARVVHLHGDGNGMCFNYVGGLKCVGSNSGIASNLGIGIAGALTEAELGFGNGDDIYGNDPTETLANAPFLEFPGVPE